MTVEVSSFNSTIVSILDVDECHVPNNKSNTIAVYLQLLQKTVEYARTFVHVCRIDSLLRYAFACIPDAGKPLEIPCRYWSEDTRHGVSSMVHTNRWFISKFHQLSNSYWKHCDRWNVLWSSDSWHLEQRHCSTSIYITYKDYHVFL